MPAAKAAREAENIEALGGLRNPNRAVARSPSLRAVGSRIRQILDRIGRNSEHRLAVQKVYMKLGTSEAQGFPAELFQEVRHALQTEFGSEASGETIFDHKLFEALLRAAGDPDVEVPKWLEHGCPTGIGQSVIHGCRVFPGIDTTSAAIEGAKVFGQMREAQGWSPSQHRNYKSFYTEGGKFAELEVNRITNLGFVEVFATWEDVVARWPHAKASKVALLIKEKADGSVKTRLIIDLLISGINGDVVLPERVVLPRLADFVNGIIDLMENDLGGAVMANEE